MTYDYNELVEIVLNELVPGEYSKATILSTVNLPCTQYNWRNLRSQFAEKGILAHPENGLWILRYEEPSRSAGALEMWSRLTQNWLKNAREDVVKLIQATDGDAVMFVARLADLGINPMLVYMICETLDVPLPKQIEKQLGHAIRLMLPEMPREMQDRIRNKSQRMEEFIAGLLPAPNKDDEQ